MPLKFSHQPDPEPARSGPPRYSSRGVQVRLLLLVFTLMFVVVAMNEARNPQSSIYRVLGFQETPQETLTDDEFADEDVDTTLRKPQHSQSQEPGVVTIDTAPQFQSNSNSGEEPTLGGLLLQEKTDRWTAALDTLSVKDHRLLFKLLKVARDQKPADTGTGLGDDERIEVLRTLRSVDEHWRDAMRESRQSVNAMPDDEEEKKLAWATVLSQLSEYWELIKDSLVIAAEGRLLISEDRKIIEELQSICDQYSLKFVEDNTVASRWQEHDAWFRTLERLKDDGGRIAQQPSQRVGFLQLFKQPKYYRGQVVTVRGKARMAYHVQARGNIYGIDGYYVFLVRPAGGPNDPMMIYSLQVPSGFPKIKDRDLDKGTTELNEDVEFTGYFFKNCAYRAKDGSRIAPLLMARAPVWEGDAIADGGEGPAWPSMPVTVGGLIALLTAAIVITMLVYRQHGGKPSVVAAYDATNLSNPAELKSLEKKDVGLSVGQRLDQLAAETAPNSEQQSPASDL